MVGAPRGYRIVRWDHDGECGLYVRDLWNAFGTPLAARGTRAELEELVQATGRSPLTEPSDQQSTS